MEDEKEGPSQAPKVKIESDFLNLLQNEIPNLKFSSVPITKEDLASRNLLRGDSDSHTEQPTQSQGFFDILGLSKRQPRDKE